MKRLKILRGKFIRTKTFIKKLFRFFNYEILVSLNGYKVIKLHRPSVMFVKNNLDKDLIIAEVGVWKGKHLSEMLNYLPIKKAYAIDAWNQTIANENLVNFTDDVNSEEMKLAEKITRKKLAKWGDKVVIVKKSSEEAVKEIKEKLDFIYIDILGSSNREFVKKTITDYYTLLKDGGVLSGHDINNGFFLAYNNGIPNEVAEFVVKNKLDLFIDREDWWFRKKSFQKLE